MAIPVAALVATTVVTMTIAGAGEDHARDVHVSAHFVSPTDTFNTLPPCDPITFTSPTNTCRGTATGHSTFTGDWVGIDEFEYGWLTVPTPIGVTYLTSLETVSGTIKGCGAGTMTYRLFATVDPQGHLSGMWRIIPALGTGALRGSTGHGTLSGTVAADFSNTGDFHGTMTCRRSDAIST
jgi:hypothetical protein